MAEELGSEETLSDALTFLGTTRVEVGDRHGLEDLAGSIEIATRAGALGALSTAYNDLSAAYQMLGDMDAAYAARVEAARVAERVGSASQIRWFQGALTDALYRRGEWDDALRKGDDFLLAVDEGSPHVLTWQVSAIRAEIRFAHDDPAWSDQRRGHRTCRRPLHRATGLCSATSFRPVHISTPSRPTATEHRHSRASSSRP